MEYERVKHVAVQTREILVVRVLVRGPPNPGVVEVPSKVSPNSLSRKAAGTGEGFNSIEDQREEQVEQFEASQSLS